MVYCIALRALMLLCLIRIIVCVCKIHLCSFACNVFWPTRVCRITPNLKAHKVVDFFVSQHHGSNPGLHGS